MTIEELKSFLSQQLELGIEDCLNNLKGKLNPNSSLDKNRRALSNQYFTARKEFQQDIIKIDDFKQERAKVHSGLLDLIDGISPVDLPHSESADPLANWPLPDTTTFPEFPFLGFHRFEEKHAKVFFGRKTEIKNLLESVEYYPEDILLLYGPSGAGKSSLIEAGLLPRLRGRDWAVEIRRRNREHGLAEDLRQAHASLMQQPSAYRLLLLDQVEEMFTNRNELLPHESLDWIEALNELWHAPQGFGATLILSFRKEHLAEIKKLLEDRYELPFRTMYIEPLSHKGINEAVAGDDARAVHFGLDVPNTLPLRIANELCPLTGNRPDDPGLLSPGTAPLLQMTLRKMWDMACGNGKKPLVPFDEKLFEKVRKTSLSDMLEQQLLELEQHFSPEPETPAPSIGRQTNEALYHAVRQGLALDVLQQFLTKERTATACSITRLEEQCYPHVADFRKLIRALKDLFILSEEVQEQKTRTRLVHDALAPLIMQRCELSDKPAQVAWNLVQAKNRHGSPTDGSADFSETDIQLIEAGRPFMEKIPDEVNARLEASRAQLEHRRAELEDKKKRMFDAMAEDALAKLIQCEHLSALQAMENAVLNGEVSPEYKQQRLQQAICEAVFFYIHTGKHSEHLQKALKLLWELPVPESVKTTLPSESSVDAVLEIIRTLEASFLDDVLHPRYFPAMVDVPGGSFTMGGMEDRDGDRIYDDEKPHHTVHLQSFQMANAPVTFYQFSLYLAAEGRNIASFRPSWGIQGDAPAINASWYDAVEYANWLSDQKGLKSCYQIDKQERDPNNQAQNDYLKWKVDVNAKASGYRLPTEAEWEYAARGGADGAHDGYLYAGGNNLEELGWYWQNSGDEHLEGAWELERINQNNGRTHPVRNKKPNQLGLHDMSGNVYEWCADWYGSYSESTVTNPQGPESGDRRVLRGGSWGDDVSYCRVSNRDRNSPVSRNYFVGFRLVRTVLLG